MSHFRLFHGMFIGAGISIAASLTPAGPYAEAASSEPDAYKTYWGDLHNHNNVGYAQGSLERTFEIAREHLDFFAFTPHGHWHDIGQYVNHIEDKWHHGFAVTRDRWPDVLAMVRKYDVPGTFVPIAGYEWHSSSLGDYCVLFPTLEAELKTFDELPQLQRFARENGCLMVPHHPANRVGHRGANFAARDASVSPVLEIFSEWGNAEHDRGPYPYIRHSHGGRWTRNTLQYLLAQGHRMGVIGSTDDHLGYPGAYRQGLAAVKATELTRGAIFDALRQRRTYAVTGDRIALDFTLNGRMMGRELAYVRQRALKVAVAGWDQVDRVEVLKNNRVIHRDFPMDRHTTPRSWDRPVLIRLEFGWGPWPSLGMARVADWDFRVTVEGGTLESVQPCFQSGPLDEGRRDRILDRSERGLRVRSFTARKQLMADNATKAVVLKLRGSPRTRLTVSFDAPSRLSVTRSLAELAESSDVVFMGPFPSESALIHRLVFDENARSEFTFTDTDDGERANWYYIRVVQANGQLAWSSPIWVEARAAAASKKAPR